MPTFARTSSEIQNLADKLRNEKLVAVDTEADSMYHYREKVCLIQLCSAGTGTVLIDPLEGDNPAPLGAVMKDPGVIKVLHGADFDITSLKRDFGWQFAGLFDTVLAARFLGWPGVGLAAVIKREIGLDIEKGPQTADWSVRPLPQNLLTYAAGDVEHLLVIYHRLRGYLADIGRLAWAEEESEAQTMISPAAEFPAPADFNKSKAARDMDPDSLAVLKCLFEAREEICLRVDRPRFKVVNDEMLARIARLKPMSIPELQKMPSIPVNLLRNPSFWIQAVRKGVESPAGPPSRPERHPRPGPDISSRVDRLRSWRTDTAARLELDPGLLLPQRLIQMLASESPGTVDQLRQIEGIRNWRCDAFGDELVAAIRG